MTLNDYQVIKLSCGDTLFGLVTEIDDISCTIEYPVGIDEKTEDAWDYLKFSDDKVLTVNVESLLYIKPLTEHHVELYKSYVEHITSSAVDPLFLTENEDDMYLQ